MEDITRCKARLLEILKEKSFRKQKVILSSGKESDYYIDARVTTLSPEGAYLTAKVMLDMAKSFNASAIGGPTIGADPIVGAIAAVSFLDKTPVPTFIVRKAAKEHGAKRRVEGPGLNSGDSVIIVDDVATTGKAFLESLEALREIGVKVEAAFCIIDRLQGAAESLADAGCKLFSIFTAKDFGV